MLLEECWKNLSFFEAVNTLKIMHLVLKRSLASSSSNMKNGTKMILVHQAAHLRFCLSFSMSSISCLSRRLGLIHSVYMDYVYDVFMSFMKRQSLTGLEPLTKNKCAISILLLN